MTPADDAEIEDDPEEGSEEGEESEEKKKLPKKKLLIFGLCGFLGLATISGIGAYFMGWLNPMLGIEDENKIAQVELGAPVNHVLPQIRADLKTGACRAPFLRATISVQLSEHDLKRLQTSQDKLMDQILVHLRDQERQDLAGKAGSDQLRFDLVNIINNVISPARIFGINFKELVLQ